LQNYLSDGDSYDIVASELYEELLVFRHTMKEDSTPIEALNFLKTMPGAFTAFPNIVISLRILLTMPITLASAEKSFLNWVRGSWENQPYTCNVILLDPPISPYTPLEYFKQILFKTLCTKQIYILCKKMVLV